MCSGQLIAVKKLPVIVHMIYRLDIGGLETVLVSFLNQCPEEKYFHVILCLTESTLFEKRIKNRNVKIIALNKKPGKGFGLLFKVFALLRSVKPKVFHSYNIACLEYQVGAMLAGVPVRVHAEHGRDNSDIHGDNKKYILLRKVVDFAVHSWVPVSRDLDRWLVQKVGISSLKIRMIHNGVDANKFVPVKISRIDQNKKFIVGTVGRLDPIKGHKNLIIAFAKVINKYGNDFGDIRLRIVGEGPERPALEKLIVQLGLQRVIDLSGASDAILLELGGFDLFVLSSKAEGIPMTVLEACACELPVVATNVGGLPEIFNTFEKIGELVTSENTDLLENAIGSYITTPKKRLKHGAAGRRRILEKFSLTDMVEQYLDLYNGD